MSFRKEKPDLLNKRINLMIANLELSKRKTIASVLLTLVMIGLIGICPNVISLEPYGIPEADADGSIGLREDNKMYYVEDKNGKYDLYMDGKYMITVESIDTEDIPVYFSTEEVNGDD